LTAYNELKDCLPGGNSEIGIKIGVREAVLNAKKRSYVASIKNN